MHVYMHVHTSTFRHIHLGYPINRGWGSGRETERQKGREGRKIADFKIENEYLIWVLIKWTFLKNINTNFYLKNVKSIRGTSEIWKFYFSDLWWSETKQGLTGEDQWGETSKTMAKGLCSHHVVHCVRGVLLLFETGFILQPRQISNSNPPASVFQM